MVLLWLDVTLTFTRIVSPAANETKPAPDMGNVPVDPATRLVEPTVRGALFGVAVMLAMNVPEPFDSTVRP